MADIGAELLEKIRAYFKKKCQGDAYIQSVLGKVAAGTAQMEEISLLSQSIGFRASQAISEFVNVAALPDGKMYYNIADTILSGVLKDNYEIINSAAAECQRALDRKMGINIEPQRAPYPAERVQAVAGAASAPDISEEKMVRRMTSTTENITRSFYDDYVETNVKYRSEAGLECFIIRSDHGGCCKWCAALAGKYRYPEEVPKDVYRRHDNCTCTVTYISGRKAQDVWSKTSRELPAEERERMKQIGFKKPTISAEEREQMLIAGMKKPQRLDIAVKSGIIEDEIRKGNIKLDINHEKQAKHIKGCPEYIDGRSYLTISEDKAQKIINEKSGTGSLVYDRKGLWKNKELIDCDEIIGVDINKSTREETSTDKGTIHYSKSGTHLVPRKEKKHD
ncbi:putative uncharacterized protein [Ruminococcus sp. CAG:579]|nr:putative uncharacterized protein [Ruminococcus sp. CAG:579]